MNRSAFVTTLGAGALATTLPAAARAAEFSGVDRAIAALAARDEFSGVAALFDGVRPVWQRAYGLANRADGIANVVQTRFNVGSLCKMFTTALITGFAHEGTLRLDATVGTYLPAYPNADVRTKVTVAQLLAMRGGVPDIFGPRFAQRNHAEIASLTDYLPFFADEPLEFEPGTQQRYSNGGFIVLGLIVEALSRSTYYEAVQRRIFDRAQMPGAGFFALDDVRPHVATGYLREDPGAPWRSNVATLPGKGSSAGGGYATAADLAAFVAALDRGVLTMDFGDAKPKTNGGVAFSLGGGAPGVHALLRASAAGGRTAIVLANMSPPAAEPVLRLLVAGSA